MPYKPLSTIYYAQREAYEAAYAGRIHSEAAIVFDMDIGGYPAFLLCTRDMPQLIANIYRLNAQIHEDCRYLPDAAISQFMYKSIIDEIRLTLDIENVRSTKREIRAALAVPADSKKKLRLLGMARKYSLLMQGTDIPLQSSRDVRDLYDDICLQEVIEEDPTCAPDGEFFRKGPVNVYGQHDRKLHTGLYPESRIIQAMEKTLAIVSGDTVELLLRCAAAHYLIGYIHPFYDGNGRLSRFISSALLSKLHPLIAVRLSYTIKSHVDAYYRAFRETNKKQNRGDLTPFTLFFLEMVHESYVNLHEALSERIQKLTYYNGLCEALWPQKNHAKWKDVAFLLLQATIFDESGIDLDTIAAYAKISRSTVVNLLKKPTYAPFLLIDRESRKHLYTIDLDALESASDQNNH